MSIQLSHRKYIVSKNAHSHFIYIPNSFEFYVITYEPICLFIVIYKICYMVIDN